MLTPIFILLVIKLICLFFTIRFTPRVLAMIFSDNKTLTKMETTFWALCVFGFIVLQMGLI